MSFGLSPSDIVALGKFAWGLYKNCRDAPSQFAEVQNEVLVLHTSLHELKDEAENPDSILNRAPESRKVELSEILRNCQSTLQPLQTLITQYHSLGTKSKKTWDRVRFGASGVEDVQRRLQLHASTSTLFLTSLGTGSLSRIEKKLDEIAADIRDGHREPSVTTVVDEDNISGSQEAWRLLKAELTEDFRPEEVETYKDEIIGYIRSLQSKGDLDERQPGNTTDIKHSRANPPSRSLSPSSLRFGIPPDQEGENIVTPSQRWKPFVEDDLTDTLDKYFDVSEVAENLAHLETTQASRNAEDIDSLSTERDRATNIYSQATHPISISDPLLFLTESDLSEGHQRQEGRADISFLSTNGIGTPRVRLKTGQIVDLEVAIDMSHDYFRLLASYNDGQRTYLFRDWPESMTVSTWIAFEVTGKTTKMLVTKSNLKRIKRTPCTASRC